MSNYYDYREVKVMIAHKLMTMEGWKVYGYKPDESDSMTDYYNPSNWEGVAEKNGYILCVNVYGASEAKEIKRYNKNNISTETSEKIEKLERITVERGASIHEEQTAKEKIELLKSKSQECKNEYEVIDVIPAHLENPPRCNWHIEKDGVIVAKGNGILKYKDAYNYYNYDRRKKDYDDFKKDSKEWANEWVEAVVSRGYYTEDRAKEHVKSVIKDMEDDWKIIDLFEKFISKIDTTCGGMIGNREIEQYEKVTVTKYKKENKIVECDRNGEIKEGQCFILKTNFNNCRKKGLVFRIHETEYDNKKYYHAYRLNDKLTKECAGKDGRNHWYNFDEKFNQWIEKGYIAFCEIKEVNTPYEVEKFIKKTVSNSSNHVTPNNTENTTENNKTSVYESKQEINYTFTIKEDTDTRDDSKIYLATCNESLSKDEFKRVMTYIKSIGGYYSRFKHAFLFKEFPSDLVDKFTEIQVEDIPMDEVNFGDAESQCVTQCNTQDETQNNIECETQQYNEEQEPQKESICVIHNEQMKTIECVTRTNSENAMKLLKGRGFVYIAGIKKFVIEYSKNVMEWLHESFIVESA